MVCYKIIMADGIAKGVGEQLGHLGKQIVKDIAQVPAKITGLDPGTNEGTDSGPGSAKQQASNAKPTAKPQVNPLDAIRQKDEIERQKQLAQARRLLDELMRPVAHAPSLKEQLEMEEMEKRKKEIEEERKKMAKKLPQFASKPKRGNLFGVKSKQFGGEVGKNVKAQ